MTEALLFPDAAELATNYLRAVLVDVPCGTRVPSPRPPRFVTLRRTGGLRTNVVLETARLSVECWGEDEGDAADLALSVRAFLFAMQGTVVNGVPVYKVDDSGGPAEDADQLSDQPRYLFSVEMTLRGSAV